MAERADVLAAAAGLLVSVTSMAQPLTEATMASRARVFRLGEDLGVLATTVAELRRLLPPGHAPYPPNVLVGYARGQATVFERKGVAGEVTMRLAIPGAAGRCRLVDDSGQELFRGTAVTVTREGVALELEPWQCVVLPWQGE